MSHRQMTVPSPNPADCLPFCRPSGGAHRPRLLWAPHLTGDYAGDTRLGAIYAGLLLPWLPRAPFLLSDILLDLAAHGDAETQAGVIVGFGHTLQSRLTA